VIALNLNENSIFYRNCLKLTLEKSGNQAGYDPIFKPEEYQETLPIIGYQK
jgi:inosine/xanthosine triphosphate pyrophosphatase family protein